MVQEEHLQSISDFFFFNVTINRDLKDCNCGPNQQLSGILRDGGFGWGFGFGFGGCFNSKEKGLMRNGS